MGRRRLAHLRFVLLILAGLIPACGGGGGGGGGINTGAAPTVIVLTPAGTQTSAVTISFTLIDPESNPVTITVEFSADGGGSYAPATAAFSNPGVAGLAASPGGIAHTYVWDSYDDGVAAGTMSGLSIGTPGTVNPQVRIRITPSDGNAGTPDATTDFTVDNTFERATAVATATFPYSTTAVRDSETEIGNLVADGMRIPVGVQLALQNGLGMRAPLPSSYLPADMGLRRPDAGYAAGPPYDLVLADVHLLLPFQNRLVTRTITGSQLWAVLEHGVSFYPALFNGFPHVSGFSFSFQASNPAGSRVLTVTLDGGAAIPNDATTYTFAVSDFINNGGDGYAMLNDGEPVVDRGLQAQVVADYIEGQGTITPVIAGRMTIVP